MEGFTESMEAAAAPVQCPLTATTLAERANAHLRQKDFDAALADCARAITSQVARRWVLGFRTLNPKH